MVMSTSSDLRWMFCSFCSVTSGEPVALLESLAFCEFSTLLNTSRAYISSTLIYHAWGFKVVMETFATLFSTILKSSNFIWLGAYTASGSAILSYANSNAQKMLNLRSPFSSLALRLKCMHLLGVVDGSR